MVSQIISPEIRSSYLPHMLDIDDALAWVPHILGMRLDF
jgi:hypothetical protein